MGSSRRNRSVIAKGTVTRQPAGRAFLYQPVAYE